MCRIALVCLAVALALPCAADVQYSVNGVGTQQYPGPIEPPEWCPHSQDPFGYPGDIVELEAHSGTIPMEAGTYMRKINTLLWTVNYTYAGSETDCDDWSDLFFDLNLPRTMTLGGVSQELSQMGLLEVTWFNDYISVDSGMTATFSVDTYEVEVTPLAFARTEALFEFRNDPPWVQPPYDLMAEFVVTEHMSTKEQSSWSTIKALYK